MTSMITATTWVPRGFAAQFPSKYDFDEEEYERIAKLAKDQLEDAKGDLAAARAEANGEGSEEKKKSKTSKKSKKVEKQESDDESEDEDVKMDVGKAKTVGEVDDDLKEYDLEHYDTSDDEDAAIDGSGERGGDAMGLFGNVKNLAFHTSNDEDPYITLGEGAAVEEEDEEREELQILPSDNLVLAARVEDEVAHLEVYVYEDSADNLYVHHDVMLPAIPLAVEWLDMRVGERRKKEGQTMENDDGDAGNFVAVATMDPDIELWDLDVVDCMYPNAVLGQADAVAAGPLGTGKKKKRAKKPHADYHVDAVLALAANRSHRNLLASGSADRTVKLWDLNTCTAAQSYNFHTDKVCSLAWHPRETTALLSGGYDKTIVAADMRAPDAGVRKWTVDADIESVRWDPHEPNHFYATTESGLLYYFDARKAPAVSSGQVSPSVWRLQAHDESVSSFDVNPVIPGFLATGSGDKQVKLWNVQAEGPSMVVSRDLDVGRVFSTQFAPDAAVGFRLAVAGSQGNMQIWDTSTNAAVRRAFQHKMATPQENVTERLVGLNLEESSSDSDEEPQGEEDEEEDDEDEDDDESGMSE